MSDEEIEEITEKAEDVLARIVSGLQASGLSAVFVETLVLEKLQ